jgi:Uma2 family endonuclease
MDAVTATAEMTATEFLALALRPEGQIRRELIDGEIVVSEASWAHNESQVTVVFALESWVRGAPRRGSVGLPLDVLLDERNVHCPDVVWYRHGRSPKRGDPIPYAIPDIAVEIRSPSTWRYDIGAKKANYERYGLPELWLVDTAADVVLVFRRSKPDAPRFDVSLELSATDELTSPLLPDFSLPVGEIFAA